MKSLHKFLSYFYPLYVESTQSDINPRIEVIYRNGKYIMNSLNTNYSYSGLYELFKMVFKTININWERVENVLILGFGAGCVVPLIRGYNSNCSIVGVEIDEKIIELGQKYFGVMNFKNTHVVHADATKYLAENQQKFDLIIVDTFIDLDVPPAMETAQFIEHLYNCVERYGMVIFNKMAYNKRVKSQVKEVEKMYSTLFPKVELYKFMDTGRIIVASAD